MCPGVHSKSLTTERPDSYSRLFPKLQSPFLPSSLPPSLSVDATQLFLWDFLLDFFCFSFFQCSAILWPSVCLNSLGWVHMHICQICKGDMKIIEDPTMGPVCLQALSWQLATLAKLKLYNFSFKVSRRWERILVLETIADFPQNQRKQCSTHFFFNSKKS